MAFMYIVLFLYFKAVGPPHHFMTHLRIADGGGSRQGVVLQLGDWARTKTPHRNEMLHGASEGGLLWTRWWTFWFRKRRL